MSNENNDTASDDEADRVPAPNGHSPANEARSEAVAQSSPASSSDAASKKRKKKRGHRHGGAKAVPIPTSLSQAEARMTADLALQPETVEIAEASVPSSDEVVESSASEGSGGASSAEVADETAVDETASSAEAPSSTAIMQESDQLLAIDPVAAAVTTAAGVAQGLRLRMKIWTDPRTGKRYVVPTAHFRDVVDGAPVSDVMHAYAIGEDDVLHVTLRAFEWQALPFVHLREEDPA